jgi:hypothetical protein
MRIFKSVLPRLAGLCLASLLVLAAAPRAGAAPVLSIQAPVTDVMVGDVFFLDVFLSGAEDLFAFDVEVAFDRTILQVLQAITGTFLGSTPGVDVDTFSEFIDNDLGEASGAQSRLVFPGVDGAGVLFSLQFRAVAPGSTNVDFDTACDVVDPFCTALRDSGDAPLDFLTELGVVNVAAAPVPVPEPTVSTLLIVGGLLGVVRRRRAR